MSNFIKFLFFLIIVKPIVLIALGLNIRGREHLPLKGPAVVVANHNSHLDTLVLMSTFPLSKINKIRPVAAADYFLANKFIKWFSLNCIGIIPIQRKAARDKNSLFDECHKALDSGDILIIFPEGTRGDPEELGKIKSGVFHLVKEREQTPIVPVVLHGLGKALPRGEGLFVPFNCDVIIGEAQQTCDSRDDFMKQLSATFQRLLQHCLTRRSTD